MWGDATGGWRPPALDWLGTLLATGVPVVAGPDAASDDGEGLLLLPDPDTVDVPLARGRPVLMGPPPDSAPARLAAVAEALGGLVVPDLGGVLVLRLDDPGAAVKRHLRSWAHPDVTPEGWRALWDSLAEHDGRVSLFCCSGWVADDGTVTPSREAASAEWALLDEGVARGVGELECHGHTHMDPDTAAWLADPDRATGVHWYRELWPPHHPVEPTAGAQQERLAAWQAGLGVQGTTVVAPGEAWGPQTLQAARACGFSMLNSWEVCRLDLPGAPAWTTGEGSPYLDEADAAHLAEGLPTVGYWHDRDMALHGPAWAPAQLDRWRDVGVRRLWSFADLGRAWQGVDAVREDRGRVTVRQAPAGVALRRL